MVMYRESLPSLGGCQLCRYSVDSSRISLSLSGFVTGHRASENTVNLDWPELAKRGDQTLVIYMGLPLACQDDYGSSLHEAWACAAIPSCRRWWKMRDATSAAESLLGDIENIAEIAATSEVQWAHSA